MLKIRYIMEDDKPGVLQHLWEGLLMPGVSWIIRREDDALVFHLPEIGKEYSINNLENDDCSVFPPDISFLLHTIIRDAEDLSLGENRPVHLVIPGAERGWVGLICRIRQNHFIIIWSGQSTKKPNSTDPRIRESILSERAIRKANEKLNFFNSIIRHDIVNLVMGLSGYLDIMGELVTDEEVLLLIKKCKDLSEKVRRVNTLTQCYQDLGNRPPTFIEATPAILRILNRREFDGLINYEVELNDLFLFVDRLFDQVILEIVRNSIKFGGNGVTIRFSFMVTPEGLVFAIEDNGPGVLPDCRERIFSRNYADRKGYGLYLAAEILDVTGAKITEVGIPGQGARFEILFLPDTYHVGDHLV